MNNIYYVFTQIIQSKLFKKFDQFLSLINNNNFITLTLRDYGFSPQECNK